PERGHLGTWREARLRHLELPGLSGLGLGRRPARLKAIEAFDGGESELRGADGMLDVVEDFPMNPIQDSILEGAQEMGIERNDDYNSGVVDGVSKMQLNVRNNKRFNTWHAYLKPIADHPNLRIYIGALVRRLLVEDATVVGVEFDYEGQTQTLRAPETVLTAGAIGSPEVLLRSGIGPAEELREVGIDPVHDVPGVGNNLHDHMLSTV